MISGLDATDDDFLFTASQVLGSMTGDQALAALGWWDVLPHLDDPDTRAATFALFRAQGRELADSPALGGLLAQPYLEHASIAPATAVAAIERQSPRRGQTWTVIGDPTGRRILFPDTSHGTVAVDASSVDLRPVATTGCVTVHEATIDLVDHPAVLTAEETRVVRPRSVQLGRLAAASEMLGSAERTLTIGVDYANDREQFGQPIGAFQAVRHLLAWARTDCVAVEVALNRGIETLADPPPRFDVVIKALAGRNTRRACERTLQVLGGIGFTAEHPHHHHHSRVLLLDGLLGSASALTRELGSWVRSTGMVPPYPSALLTGVVNHPDPKG